MELRILKSLLLAILFIISATLPIFAEEDSIKVNVSGTEVNFPDQKPVTKDGRVLVPVRGVFELLVPEGSNKDEIFKVTWDSKTSTATIKNKWYTVKIQSGKKSFTSNGKSITPDVPPQIINGRLMLPIRAVAESVDAQVEWDGADKTVKIYYKSEVKVSKK
jgi:hypothetical protein